MILAGDVGGTKTVFGLFRLVGGVLRCEREETFASREFSSLETMAGEFLSSGKQRVRRAAIGVAGPVVGGVSQLVNLPWSVRQRRFGRKIGVESVQVFNDLVATAWGIPELSPRKLLNLTPRLRPGAGNAVVIAAGTGLGMAWVLRDGDRWIPAASEGGHQDFGPRDDLEIALLRHLRRKHGRVSLERIVAGPGFSAIYEFLIDNGWGHRSDRMMDTIANTEDPNAAIGQAGMRGEDPVAEKTVEMFLSLYGSAAGNLALAARATGGVYVGGGIAPKLLTKMRAGGFIEAFRDKGRLTPLLQKICIRVILEPRTALIGAAAAAAAQNPAMRKKHPPRRRAKTK